MSTARHSYLDWDGPIAFAHRGGALDVPENTMPAFERAVSLGYRYVETDVQVTSDGVLVAFHDDDLSRTCGRQDLISRLPWREVQTALVDGASPIPLLEELLGSWPDLRVNIDCKSDAAAPALIATLRRNAALGRVCVSSFSNRRIRLLRAALGDQLCTALGPAEIAMVKYGQPLRSARWTPARVAAARVIGLAAQVPVRHGRILVTDRRFVQRAHALGVQVHVWVIDEAIEMERLLDIGVDGIMTDRPAVLRQVLEKRGVWSA